MELKRISEMRDLADPRLALEQLQAEKAAGKVEVRPSSRPRTSDPIVLTVTPNTSNPERAGGVRDQSQARLVERITFFRRTGGKWEQMELRQYLEYNQPIDPKIFQPDMPNDVMVATRSTGSLAW